MNSYTASQFMDKQIMDLSNSQNSSGNNDFIDFTNRSDEKSDDIVPSYDFMPIRPGFGSSSPLPTAHHVSKFDTGEDDASLRTLNSLDSKINVSSNRNQISLDIDEPAKFVLGQTQQPLSASLSASLVSEIDKKVKKYTDNLMHTMDGVSARLSQLETRTHKLETSMDDLKESVGNNFGVIDENLRQMGNILREVQTGVQVIRDKQARVGELPAAKLQSLNLELVESQNLAHTELTQSVSSANQQFSTFSLTQPPPSLPPPNAPPPPPQPQPQPQPQQNSDSHVQFSKQYSQNQTNSVPQQESYFRPSGQTPQQQYQVPPSPHQHQLLAPPPQHQNQPPQPQHQHQPAPPQPPYSQPPPPQHQYQPPPPPQPHSQPPPPPQPHSQPPPPPQPHSQPPPPPQPHSQPPPPPQPHSQPPPPPQLHPQFSSINTSLLQPQLSHRSEESLYGPPQTYPSGIRPPLSHPSVGVPPPQQLYSPTTNVYEPQSSRPIPGYSHSFGQSAGHVEPYHNSSPSQYGSDLPRKPQQFPSNAGGLGAGSGYSQLPTARILPQAIPTASNVGGGSGSGSSGNKVPVDDVVEKVTHMGFPRDQVRATVRKLTENGQSVDLNVVLDKLMNDNEGQAPRGWFSR